MKKTLFGVLALLCLNFGLKAQTPVSNLQPLRVGQSLPDSVWNLPMKILNSDEKEVTLKSFQGKLIILDFWATWCTSCIKKFPMLTELQQEFSGDLAILLVNSSIKGDTPEKMMAKLKGYPIASIINDKVLKVLFPHEYIPHYVWIDGKGKVFAITSSKFVDSDVIKNALKLDPKLN